MVGTFDARFLEFGLGSFGALCKISNFTIFETRLRSQFSSDSTKLYTNIYFIQCIIIMQAVTVLAIGQKLQKLWYFEIFLKQDHYAAVIFKVLFLPPFSLESIQTL